MKLLKAVLFLFVSGVASAGGFSGTTGGGGGIVSPGTFTWTNTQGISVSTITASTMTVSGQIVLRDGTIIRSTATFASLAPGSSVYAQINPPTQQTGSVNLSSASYGSAWITPGVSGGGGAFSLIAGNNWGNPFFSSAYGGYFKVQGGLILGASYGVAAENFANGQPAYGGYFASSGSGILNYGIYGTASGSTSNYGLYIAAGQAQINSSMTVTGTASFNNGIISSTMTVSTQTVTGQIVLKDGTVMSSTSTFGGSASSLLVATQTWSGANNWTGPTISTFTYGVTVGSLTVNGTGAGQFIATEGSAPSGAASSDVLYANSTNHRLQMINNNGTDYFVAGILSGSLTTLQAATTIVGTIGICTSGCSTDFLCVSTGTIHSFVRTSASTTACQ